jgi:hypothetical protein
MADKEERVERVVVIDHAEAARMAAERKLAAGDTPPLDKAKAPGGVYQSSDGRYHNANGDEVTEDGDPVEVEKPKAAQEEDDDEWRADMKAQRRESAKTPAPPGAPITGDTYLPPLDDEEDEEGEATPRKARKRSRK